MFMAELLFYCLANINSPRYEVPYTFLVAKVHRSLFGAHGEVAMSQSEENDAILRSLVVDMLSGCFKIAMLRINPTNVHNIA